MIIIYAMNFTLKIDLLGFSQFLPVIAGRNRQKYVSASFCQPGGRNRFLPGRNPTLHLSGQNLSEWMKTIWVDETYLSGRNLSEWKKPIWVDVHSDGVRPLI